MSLNSFVPTFKFLLVSNAFLKTLNSFLILIKSANTLSVWFFVNPTSLPKSLNSFVVLASKPLNVTLPPWTTSSPAVNNSSTLPTILLKVGVFEEIPLSFSILNNVLSISNIKSLATIWPEFIWPSTSLIPWNNFSGLFPLGLRAPANLSIHWSNLSLLLVKSSPCLDNFLPIAPSP